MKISSCQRGRVRISHSRAAAAAPASAKTTPSARRDPALFGLSSSILYANSQSGAENLAGRREDRALPPGDRSGPIGRIPSA